MVSAGRNVTQDIVHERFKISGKKDSQISGGPLVSGQFAETADRTTSLTARDRPLREYVASVTERSDFQVGVILPRGTYAHGQGLNFAFLSRTPRACGWS